MLKVEGSREERTLIMNHGRAIRIARAARRLTQKELAVASGLDPSYISLIEAEQRTPSSRAVELVGRVLGVPPHLMALLAAEPADVVGLPPEQAGTLGRDLLALLITSDAPLA
jgi:transcriptional regulator with XRE-family HTH domain